MFSFVDLESRILPSHPIRKIRRIVDAALMDLEPAFAEMCSGRGRLSIPPEQPLRALLLQILFTIRSERLLMERIDHGLLVRGLGDRRFGFRPFAALQLNTDEIEKWKFVKLGVSMMRTKTITIL